MGFGNRAQKRAEKAVLSHFAVGEALLAYELGSVSLNSGRKTPVDVIVSNRAIYFATEGSVASRLSLTAIQYFEGSSGMTMRLATNGGGKVYAELPRNSTVIASVEALLYSLQRTTHTKTVNDISIRLEYYPWRRHHVSSWVETVGADAPDKPPSLSELRKTAHAEAEGIVLRTAGRAPAPHRVPLNEMDLTGPVEHFLRSQLDLGEFQWARGHVVDAAGSGRSTCLATSDEVLYFIELGGLEVPYASAVVPIEEIADYIVEVEPDGAAKIITLLHIPPQFLHEASLSAAMNKIETLGTWRLGLPATDQGARFERFLVTQINASGAYAPAARDEHPLRPTTPIG